MTPVTSRSSTAKNKKSDDPYSILLMGFGQSNADVHDAGPRLFPDADSDLPIVMPNDGRNFRGWGYFEQAKEITGFLPVTEASEKIQSLLAAASGRILNDISDEALKRIIIRSAACGGRRFNAIQKDDVEIEGIYKRLDGSDSTIFSNFIASLDQCIAVAQDEGLPVKKIYVVWLHGESDRAMEQDEYSAILSNLMDATERRLSDRGTSIDWALVQASGSGTRGGGNAWPNRLSIFDVANARENVTVVCTGYAYEMIDGSHYSGYGKLQLGENIGRRISDHLSDTFKPLPRPIMVRIEGTEVSVKFQTSDPLCFDTSTFTPPDDFYGFSATDRPNINLTGVAVTSDDTVTLSFSEEPDPDKLKINYAFMHNRRGATFVESSHPVGRGSLRTVLSTPSCLKPDEILHDWVPGFSILAKDFL
jgi:hypothetical protein